MRKKRGDLVFTVGQGQNSLKQPKLLLTTVWPIERFQQLDSIKGFLRGGRPHPCCMSHFLKHTRLDNEGVGEKNKVMHFHNGCFDI